MACFGSPNEHVVVGEHLHRPLALVDLAKHSPGEPPADRLDGPLVRLRRHEGRRRMLEHLLADAKRLLPADPQIVRRRPEAPDIEVVDNLLEQIAGILDQGDVLLDVAGGAEPGEDLHAEAVGGLYRGGVEIGDRLGEAILALLHLGVRSGGQQAEEVVVGIRLFAGEDDGQPLGGADEALPHPFAKLPRRHAGERHDQEAVKGHALGDIAGGEAGDRERLAGAGTRLQQSHTARKWSADVERLRGAPSRQRRRGGATHRSTSCS
jgi:hypothetical protein